MFVPGTTYVEIRLYKTQLCTVLCYSKNNIASARCGGSATSIILLLYNNKINFSLPLCGSFTSGEEIPRLLFALCFQNNTILYLAVKLQQTIVIFHSSGTVKLNSFNMVLFNSFVSLASFEFLNSKIMVSKRMSQTISSRFLFTVKQFILYFLLPRILQKRYDAYILEI